MPQTPHQRRASDGVAAWLAHHQRNPTWLAVAAEADLGTISDFLNGSRWPKLKTQGRIESAIGWPSGTIRQVGNGGDVPATGDAPESDPVGADTEDGDSLLYKRPAGLSDREWDRLKDETEEYIEWLLDRASRRR